MKKIYIAFILFALTISSCNDYLDFKQEVEREAATMDYSDPDNIFKPVSAAYANLRDFGLHAFPYIGLFEITSDNASKGSIASDNPPMQELDEFSYGPNNELIAVYWSSAYSAISSANNALEQMPKFKLKLPVIDTAKVDPIAAEAKTLRAYYYFMLGRAFGGVPLITKSMSSEELNSVKRKTQEEIYNFIESELKWSITKLPEFYPSSELGRITKYTAKALLAKLYMYRENWIQAKIQSDDVITYAEASGKLGLYGDFYYLFRIDGENSKESLFEVQASYIGKTTGTLPTVDYSYVQGPRNNASALQGWGFCTPTDELEAFFAKRGDTKRAEATLLYSGRKTIYGDSIYAYPDRSPNRIYNGKAYTPASQNVMPDNSYGKDNNIRLLRYADVLLINAEAKLHVGGDFATPFNQVRARVGLSPISSPTEQDIWDERRAELAMEEDRFLDLVRTGQASKVLKGYQESKNKLFPIPAKEIATNPNLEQNPNY